MASYCLGLINDDDGLGYNSYWNLCCIRLIYQANDLVLAHAFSIAWSIGQQALDSYAY
jgi:hypothetical protein